jgi:two-component system, NtrC family, nitrogen regulation sensor histidine kinase NtrY
MRHETRITLLALGGGAPALIVALVLVWNTPLLPSTRLAATIGLVATWVLCATALHERVVRSLQTLSNLVSALREGDYSIRARGADPASPLGLAYHEINALAESLHRERLDALEAMALLRRVMESIDVAVFAFDTDDRLTLLNAGGERLIELPGERAIGLAAGELGLAGALEGTVPRLVELDLPAHPGRLELRRGDYRWAGRPHRLVVLSDLTRTLREEERLAFQRLVRVLSHEINNSLAPIQSIAGSLRSGLERGGEGGGAWPRADLDHGLEVIETRARSLGRFLQAYARLTRLPPPEPRAVAIDPAVRRAVSLEDRVPMTVTGGPDVALLADGDQLDALIINLLRNAADATLETGGGVRISWSVVTGMLVLAIEDDGPGLSDTRNLFVPFFTTKPGGTGIGLALCRQIAEAHGGSVTLRERVGARGSIATVRWPVVTGMR